jgi:Ca-activated chloride channel family protein
MMSSVKAAAVLIGLAGAGAAQVLSRQSAFPDRQPIIRTDATLVLVPVTVTDEHGTPVPSLTASDFVLREDKKVQDIVSFSRENTVLSLGVVVDLSGSMATKMAMARAAVHEFIRNLESEDETFLVTFADRPELRLAFGSDPSAIGEALRSATPRGSTALFDAVALAVRHMRQSQNRRKVLFLVSDGGDNHSRLTERELRHLIDEEDVQIHAIGIHDRSDRMDEARGPWILEDLAKMTGGEHHMVNNVVELPKLAAKMSLALHERYLLAYRPTPGLAGVFRKVEVKVIRRMGDGRVWVYARRGYRMP